MYRLCRLLLGIGFLLVVTFARGQAQVWDLSSDFSISSNPNGVWSYGAKEGTLSANLILFTDTATVPALYNTQQLAGWSNPAYGVVPYAVQNISAEDWVFDARSQGNGIAILHPQEVLLHPSTFGNTFSVVRWTAPNAGLYTLEAAFRRFQDLPGYNSSYAVAHNGVALPGGSGILVDFGNPESSASYSNSSLFVNAGDSLEFAVGIGTDGTSNTDGTTVSARIELVYETVTVSGRITLQGAINQAQPVIFEFRPTDGSEPFTRSLTLNLNRTFTLSHIPKNTYTIRFKGAKWLAKVLSVDGTHGNVTGVNTTLQAGDANNDNVVDVEDLAAFIEAFDADPDSPNWNGGVADFNTDDIVDQLDLDLLIHNFDAEGDA